MHRSLVPALVALLAAMALVACSDAPAEEGPAQDGGGGAGGSTPPAFVPCGAEKAASCRSRQLGCGAGSGEELCSPCAAGTATTLDGSCSAILGTVHENGFGAVAVPSGAEDTDICLSWTLDNPEELLVNAVEIDNDGAWHHSNWFFVPDDRDVEADGSWPCSRQHFSEVEAALAGGVLYAQSTQATHEVERFPQGVVIRIPPWSRVIGSAHTLNVTPDDLSTEMRMKLYTLPAAQARVKLTPFRLNYSDLEIPPRASSTFGGSCDLDHSHQALFHAPLALKLYYVLPHTHALGTGVRVGILGGPRDGETIFAAPAFGGEANGLAFDPPIDLAGATGFTFECGFTNPRDETVHWGFGDQEMCEALLYADTELLSDSTVDDGAFTETTADGIQHFSGACTTLGFRADHDKAGGPPR